MTQSVLSCTVVPTTWGKTLVLLKLGRQVAVSCKLDINKILLFGIIPRRDKLNAKAAQANSFPKK